ncbi:MAG: hypothetical protein IKI64_04235 [Clostridia bacterium]|nr:hypothetical protein [Clostridia bacterium]
MFDPPKKQYKRILAVLLAAAALAVLAACEPVSNDISFKNELKVPVNIYFSRADDDSWSDKPTAVNVVSGAETGIAFSRLDSASGKRFDVGAIDENGMNYDIYDVVLIEGDLITLSGDESEAHFTITHSDGTSTVLSAHIRKNGD